VPEVDAQGYGEVVYTTLSHRAMPLIRYRSSDRTQLVDHPCACGISMGRLAKIRGRCDELVVCGMGNVGPWVFEEILRGVPGLGGDWQVVIGQHGTRDVVDLHVEMEDAAGQSAVQTGVLRHLRERFGDFWRNREMGLYDLYVRIHPLGVLRGQGRKLRRVVDQRRRSDGTISSA
jgi:phenylacetate-CoA ligase